MKHNPCVVAVSGVKNSGKTRLITQLVPELTARGLRVAVIKHDGHRFEADRPGTDSHAYLTVGAVGTAVFDGEKYQLIRRTHIDENALLAQFPDADLVLLEGFKHSRWPKLELFRSGISEGAVCHSYTRLAFIADAAPPEPGFPVFSPEKPASAAAYLADFARLGKMYSAILLAGGRSSRMGRSKAELPFGGRRMIDHQIERLSMLGIDDVIVAGYDGTVSHGRTVPDKLPHRGPLGGLASALPAAANESCLVLSVDAPLVPPAVLFELMRHHRGGITVVEHGGQTEPLIGVYDRALSSACEELLAGGQGSVKCLFRAASFSTLSCEVDALLLSNCNTNEEYRRMVQL